MRIYTSTCYSPDQLDIMAQHNMGMLLASSPSGFIVQKKMATLVKHHGIPVAADNGAFSAWQKGWWFDEWAFLRLLNSCRVHDLRPEWVIAPDLPARGAESLAFSRAWMARIPDIPWALAVQNGMEPETLEVPRGTVRIFVGGDMEWKWARLAEWVEFGREHGLPVHVGRCGSPHDIELARLAGVDSVDSSSFVRNQSWHHLIPKPGDDLVDLATRHLAAQEAAR